MKLLGQFLENPNTLDTGIIGHACKALLLNLIGTVEVPERDATRTDYKKLIFTHLKFKPFNEEIMNKASCLSLVSNAVLYWNTVKMTEIIVQLKQNGETISDETLAHISLLPHKHLNTMGTYFTYSMIEPLETKDV